MQYFNFDLENMRLSKLSNFEDCICTFVQAVSRKILIGSFANFILWSYRFLEPIDRNFFKILFNDSTNIADCIVAVLIKSIGYCKICRILKFYEGFVHIDLVRIFPNCFSELFALIIFEIHIMIADILDVQRCNFDLNPKN